MRASAFLPLQFLAACAHAAAPVVAPPAPPPEPPPAAREEPAWEPLTVCVVRDGVLREVEATYDPATGDSLYEGRRLRDAFPADSAYAASAAWYHRYEPITFQDRRYVSYGLPRILRPGDVESRGEYRGLTVFAEPVASRTIPEVVYLAVRPTCEFQPYTTELYGGTVRGR